MILPAQTIRSLGILEPCSERTEFGGVTYGLGPAGYDLRIVQDIDLWPGRQVLADAVEYFRMPDDVMGILYTKSTWARLHIECPNTVIEPGWFGHLRLEINMHGGREPRTIQAGTGVAQVVFYRLEAKTEQPYKSSRTPH